MRFTVLLQQRTSRHCHLVAFNIGTKNELNVCTRNIFWVGPPRHNYDEAACVAGVLVVVEEEVVVVVSVDVTSLGADG